MDANALEGEDTGRIDARGQDLNSILVHGNLNALQIGDIKRSTRALVALEVDSIGTVAEQDHVSLIACYGSIRSVHVHGDVQGTSVTLLGRGKFGADMGELKVDGNLIAEEQSTSVSAAHLGMIEIGGHIVGTAENNVFFGASGGKKVLNRSDSVAIARVSVGGSVEYLQIVAGMTSFGQTRSGFSIGTVEVGGN